jgi:tryptophan-rich sensory protein
MLASSGLGISFGGLTGTVAAAVMQMEVKCSTTLLIVVCLQKRKFKHASRTAGTILIPYCCRQPATYVNTTSTLA